MVRVMGGVSGTVAHLVIKLCRMYSNMSQSSGRPDGAAWMLEKSWVQ